ncbi:MAG: hypothetical protein L3I99_06885 [Sulfurimonas sp.]|nr:hypothetical protein [Sulfurimonas sp.]
MALFSFKNSFFLFVFFILFINFGYAKIIKHPSYAKGQCGACHTTKSAKSPDLKMEMPELCYSCHTNYEENDFIHGPVGAGACTLCHNPHESKNQNLLTTSTVNELCTSCHSNKDDMLKSGENIHPPVQDSCINCHDAHGQKHKFQLKADRKKDLCLTCHTDKKERITNSINKHGAIEMGEKCLGCHDPHSSPNIKLLKAEDSKTICLTCHSTSLPRDEDGKMLMNMGEHIANNPNVHGPIMWGDCAACHDPHGSDNLRMLKSPFPEKSSAKFTSDGYICFQCHEPKKMTEKFTKDLTEFRNADKNIHYLHVNAKRISCKTCHDYHASDLPHHLRDKATFGSAKFPLRFIKTLNGGSCNPICHTIRYYDRVEPVNVRTNKKL